jgi:hypothetical protein
MIYFTPIPDMTGSAGMARPTIEDGEDPADK